jgi:protein-tyrosine phosphatase
MSEQEAAGLETTSVLMVCLGNICRSPLAEGILKHIALEAGDDWVRVDSAGTSAYHVGERPHDGSLQIAQERGVSLAGQHSRQVQPSDYQDFDWLVAMDTSNRNSLTHNAPQGYDMSRIVLLLDYARGDSPREVPDPYYTRGFGYVFDLVEDGCQGFLEHLRSSR